MLYGCDTSAYQGDVNWHAVKTANIAFGIPKATEATQFEDPRFPASWAGLASAGLPRIVYHFFHDSVPGVEQCDYMHDYVRRNGRFLWGDMVALDVEEVGVTDAARAVGYITDFIQHAWSSIDKPVIIYTNYDTWVSYLGNPTNPTIAQCPLWQATLGYQPQRLKPWPKGPSFEQWSWHGVLPGISGPVDLDRFLGNRVQLDKVRHRVPRI